MVKYVRKGLKERLIKESLVTAEQFEIAMKEHAVTSEPVRFILIKKGYISETKLIEFLGVHLKMPFLKSLEYIKIDPEVLNLISEKLARKYSFIPLSKSKDVLTIVIRDPFDVVALDEISSYTKYKIETILCGETEIIKAIDKYYKQGNPLEEILKGTSEELEVIGEEFVSGDEVATEEAPLIIKLVNLIISQAIKERASDIHIEPARGILRIRYRIDGILEEAMVPPKHLQAAIASRIKIMAEMNIAEVRIPQDGQIKVKLENKDVELRVSTMPGIYGETIVMRVLEQSTILIGLVALGFGEDVLPRFERLINHPYGIILVTGPTGSGKTTTLYSVLNKIKSMTKNIITIENPVEYRLELINQIDINPKAGITFPVVLRSVVRQDTDVIMIGEIRDLETAEIAIRCSLTGQLVFSTLHTNNAAGAVTRLIDIGIPPYLVASSVICVLAQRLVRRFCLKCKQPYTPNDELLEKLGLSRDREYTFYQPKGCEECRHTGYFGRICIAELMVMDKTLRELTLKSSPTEVMEQEARQSGKMKTLWEDGVEKIIAGVTSVEEVKRVSIIEEE